MSITVEILESKGYEEVACFLEKQVSGVLTQSFWRDRFDKWWVKNPYYQDSIPCGWVLKDHTRIVGFYGNIPVQYFVNGARRLVYVGTSWYVEPSYRNYSLQLFMNFLKQPQIFLNTTAAPIVQKILPKFGFERFMPEWIRRDYLYILNFPRMCSFIYSKLRGYKKIISIFLFPFLWIIFLCQLLFRLKFKKSAYRAARIREFNSDYDDFFKKFCKDKSTTVVRDRRTLNWFFCNDSGNSSPRVIVELRRKEELIGYAVVKIVKYDNGVRKYFWGELVDFALIENNRNAYLELFRELVRTLRNDFCDIAFMSANPFDGISLAAFRQMGFISYAGRSTFFVKGFSVKGFYATALDGDRPFFP